MTRRARVKVKPAPGTRTEAAAEFSRKKAKLRRKQWNRRALMIGTLVLGIYAAGGSWWLIHTGKLEKALTAMDGYVWKQTMRLGFRLEQVTLTGRVHADPQAVRDALDLYRGAPILSLSLADMRQRLETIPEVKSALITRTLPSTITIEITERTPAAWWQHNGALELIDREGVVLPRDKYHEKITLPVVVGSDAPKHMAELIALLDTVPSLKTDVVAAVRVGGRRWNIQLARDIVVLLPEDDPAKAWKRFADLVATQALLSKAIRSVDMRVEDRVFIIPTEEKKSPITLTTARDI